MTNCVRSRCNNIIQVTVRFENHCLVFLNAIPVKFEQNPFHCSMKNAFKRNEYLQSQFKDIESLISLLVLNLLITIMFSRKYNYHH